jgi:hypothetical protein
MVDYEPSFRIPLMRVKRTSCFDGSYYDRTPPQALRAVPALIGLLQAQMLLRSLLHSNLDRVWYDSHRKSTPDLSR